MAEETNHFREVLMVLRYVADAREGVLDASFDAVKPGVDGTEGLGMRIQSSRVKALDAKEVIKFSFQG